MPDDQDQLCDSCGKWPATIFTTKCFVGGVGAGEQSKLCDTCYAAEANPQQCAISDALKKGCVYCGATAESAGVFFGQEDQEPAAVCGECAKAAHDFMLAALGFDPKEIASGEKLDFLAKLEEMSPEAKAEAIRKMNGLEEYLRGRRH